MHDTRLPSAPLIQVKSIYLKPLILIHKESFENDSIDGVTIEDLQSSYHQALHHLSVATNSSNSSEASIALRKAKDELEALHESLIESYETYFKIEILPQLLKQYQYNIMQQQRQLLRNHDDNKQFILQAIGAVKAKGNADSRYVLKGWSISEKNVEEWVFHPLIEFWSNELEKKKHHEISQVAEKRGINDKDENNNNDQIVEETEGTTMGVDDKARLRNIADDPDRNDEDNDEEEVIIDQDDDKERFEEDEELQIVEEEEEGFLEETLVEDNESLQPQESLSQKERSEADAETNGSVAPQRKISTMDPSKRQVSNNDTSTVSSNSVGPTNGRITAVISLSSPRKQQQATENKLKNAPTTTTSSAGGSNGNVRSNSNTKKRLLLPISTASSGGRGSGRGNSGRGGKKGTNKRGRK